MIITPSVHASVRGVIPLSCMTAYCPSAEVDHFFLFLFFPLLCGWTFWLIRCLGYCESCGPENRCVCVIMKEDFSLVLSPEVGLLDHKVLGGSLGGSDGKESTWSVGDMGSIPGWGRSPGGGHGNPLQSSCLENPMDGEPGGLQSMGSQRFRQNWATFVFTLLFNGFSF